MIDWLASTIIVISVGLAVVTLVTVARTAPFGPVQFGGVAVVELLVLGQGITAVTQLARGTTPEDPVLFIGYLLTAVLALPAALSWAMMERTRWAIAVIALGHVTVAALILRMQQLWTIGG